jgi:hypothetical protein
LIGRKTFNIFDRGKAIGGNQMVILGLCLATKKLKIFNMVSKKLDDKVLGQIKCYFELKWSYSVIQAKLLADGIRISKGYLSTLKKKLNCPDQAQHDIEAKPRCRPCKLSDSDLISLNRLTDSPNPPTQTFLVKKFNVTQSSISYNISTKLNNRCLKKPHVHYLSQKSKEKRFERAMRLYKWINGSRWDKILTTDETWFYLTKNGEKTRIQYLPLEKSRDECELFEAESNNEKIMVAAGISSRGATKPIFIDPTAKVNSDFYIENVLPHYFTEMERLFPEGGAVFHQDSAPAHVSQ